MPNLTFSTISQKTLIDRLIKQGIGEKTATLLAELTNSFEKAVEISQDEWFNEAREIILQWFNYLKSNDLQAFIYVQKKMVKVFKEKNNKRLALTCSWFITVNYWKKVLRHSKPKSNGRAGGTVGANFESTPKWTANVSWQNVCEQLVIQMIHPKS